jgi:hypothetical protein
MAILWQKAGSAKVMSFVTALAILVSLFPALSAPAQAAEASWTVAAGYTGGSGTSDDPYLISTAGQLAYLAQMVNGGEEYQGKHFKMTDNIDLQTQSWTPIGVKSEYFAFSGAFDGCGHQITNLAVNITGIADGTAYAGLFGYVRLSCASIVNLDVSGTVKANGGTGNYAGGIAAYCFIGTIKNCSFTGTVSSTGGASYNYAGGIAGFSEGSTIGSCKSSSAVTADGGAGYAGGIAGNSTYYDSGSEKTYAVLTNCTSAGTVTVSGGTYGYTGGIAGVNDTGCTVESCRSSGIIRADAGKTENYAGGLIGSSNGSLNASSFEGTVTANGAAQKNYAGGLEGFCDGNGLVQSCYADASVASSNGVKSNISGGLSGFLAGKLINCYQTGQISAAGGTGTASQNESGGLSGELNVYYNNDGGNVGIYNCYHTGGAVSSSGGAYSFSGGLSSQTVGYASAVPVIDGSYWRLADCGKGFTYLNHTCTSIGTFPDSGGKLTASNDTRLLYGSTLLTALNTWVSAYNGSNYSGKLSKWIINAAQNNGYPILEIFNTNKTALPTSSAVTLNGSVKQFEAYIIDGSNYFKLRDLAAALNGTAKQFAVGYDGAANAITLTTGSAYTPVGGELASSGKASSETAVLSAAKIYVNGKNVSLTAYTIGGSNYFNLREVAAAINFSVTWDSTTSTIKIDTSAGYTAG